MSMLLFFAEQFDALSSAVDGSEHNTAIVICRVNQNVYFKIRGSKNRDNVSRTEQVSCRPVPMYHVFVNKRRLKNCQEGKKEKN